MLLFFQHDIKKAQEVFPDKTELFVVSNNDLENFKRKAKQKITPEFLHLLEPEFPVNSLHLIFSACFYTCFRTFEY